MASQTRQARPSLPVPPRHRHRHRHRLLTRARWRYLFLGLLLRAALLLFGLYQDAHSPLSYTDVDYSVFLSGARHLVHGCPLAAAAPPAHEPMEDLAALRSPPLAPVNGCAQGWLAVGARYILQHEEILVLRSRASGGRTTAGGAATGTTPAERGAHEALRGLQEGSALSYMPPSKIETTLLPLCLAVLRPILRPLATMGNPYARPTYRYTPLLAALLAPGAWLGGTAEKLWGKLLFVLADVLAAVLMWDIAGVCMRARATARAVRTRPDPKDSSGGSAAARAGTSLLAAVRRLPVGSDPTHAVGVLWLLNPFPAQIATRGSSEAVLGVLILGFLAAAVRLVGEGEDQGEGGTPEPEPQAETPSETNPQQAHQDSDATTQPQPQPHLTLLPALPAHAILAPLLLALAAHLKLFPALYGFSVLAALLLGRRPGRRGPSSSATSCRSGPAASPTVGGPRWSDALAFTAMSLYVFLGLGLLVWAVWGQPFLDESLLYHVRRTDHRHNFSPYFLPLYLAGGASASASASASAPAAGSALPAGASGLAGTGPRTGASGLPALSSLASLAFLPQLLVVVLLALRLAPHAHALPLACAAQTLAFVAWNKVSTSQYFVWYLQFLPVLLPFLSFEDEAQAPARASAPAPAAPSASGAAAAGSKASPPRHAAPRTRSGPSRPHALVLAWSSSQAAWLAAAYALEFRARDVFATVWAAGLLFMGVNAWVLLEVVRAWFRAAAQEARGERGAEGEGGEER